MALRPSMIHKVVKQANTGKTGIVADSRYDGMEIRVKWSEGGAISDWLDSCTFEVEN